MTHTRPMDESEGEFAEAKPAGTPCRKCQSKNTTCAIWESHDGAYEDFKYTCLDCKHVWWVDGIDS